MNTEYNNNKETSTNELEEVRKSLVQVAEKGSLFYIIGYKSGSGSVLDYNEIKFEDKGFYHSKVAESLEWIKKAGRPLQFSPEVWTEAMVEQVSSWQKTLDGAHTERNMPKIESAGGSQGNVWIDEKGRIILTNMSCASIMCVERGAPKKESSNPKVVAKEYMRSNAPVNDFIPRLVLEEGKYQEIIVHLDN